MRRCLLTYLLAGLALLLPGVIRAADYEFVGILATAVDPEVATQLGLTPNQLDQLNQIIDAREAEAVNIIYALGNMPKADRDARLAEFRRDSETKGLPLLSDVQRDKLQRLHFRRAGLASLGDPTMAGRMKLSADQQSKIATILRERNERMQKAGEGSAHIVRAETERRLATVLDENQRDAWESMVRSEGSGRDRKVEPAKTAETEPKAKPEAKMISQAEPAKTAEAPPAEAKPSEAKPAEAKPAEAAKTTEPAKPTETPKAAETAKPSEPTKPAEVAKPVETAKPGEAPKPAEVAKPGEPSKDVVPPSTAAKPEMPKPETAAKPEAAPEAKPEKPEDSGHRRWRPRGEGEPDWPAPPPGGPSAPGPKTDPHPGEPAKPSDVRPQEVAKPAEARPGETAKPATPRTPGKLQFSFHHQPWKDVLEWFAEQADLSLMMDNPPKGTFNYTDNREYTPAEAIDLLNSVLLTKGYTLVRRQRVLFVINLEDGIPKELIDTITESDLDGRGEYELVSVPFTLRKMAVEDAEQEVRKLLGPQGSIIVLPKSRQLLVTETAGKLRTIRRVIQSVENPEEGGAVQTVEPRQVTPQEAMTMLRQLLDVPADKFATTDGSVRFALDPSGKKILITGKPEAVARALDLLRAIDGKDGGNRLATTPQLEVYPISGADPAAVLQVMQTLLAGEPDVRLALDPKTGSLVAYARPAQHSTIRATLDQLQRDARRVEVIQLRTLEPAAAVGAITKLFGGDANAASAPKVEADLATRQLLVRGSADQITQIRDMLSKMGENVDSSKVGGSNVRMLPLTGRNVRSALDRAQEVWPTIRKNPIRVVTPSGSGIPTVRPHGDASPSPDAAPAGEGKTTPPAPTPSGKPSSLPEQRSLLRVPEAGPTAAGRRVNVRFAAEERAPAKPQEKPVGIPGAPIIVSPGPTGVMIASEDIEALNEFEELLRTLSGGASNKPEITVFYLKYAKANSVAETLDQIFGGGGGGEGGSLLGDLAGAALGQQGGGMLGSLLGAGGDSGGSARPSGLVQITPDPRLNALIVQAGPADLDMIEELLKILDQKDSPEDILAESRPRLIPIHNMQAQEAADIVKSVYQDRMTAGAGGQQRQPTPQEFIQMLRGGRGGGGRQGRRGTTEEAEKMSIGVDARSNSLVVVAPDALFQEVKALVDEIDKKAVVESNEAMEIVTLHRSNSTSVEQALKSLLGESVKVGRTAAQPAAQPAQPGQPGQFSPFQGGQGFQFNRGLNGGFNGGMPGGGSPYGGRSRRGGQGQGRGQGGFNRGGFNTSGFGGAPGGTP